MTRDAKNEQSVERCKYNHDWTKTDIYSDYAQIASLQRIVCKTCGHFPKNEAQFKEADAIISLRGMLKPGDTVYTVLRRVSRSGMSRNIDLYFIDKDCKPRWISGTAGHALGRPQSRKNWEQSQGLTVGGCGMDMGFHLVYSLGRVLFPKGFKVKGRGRNGDTSGQDNDGGYALKHEWL